MSFFRYLIGKKYFVIYQNLILLTQASPLVPNLAEQRIQQPGPGACVLGHALRAADRGSRAHAALRPPGGLAGRLRRAGPEATVAGTYGIGDADCGRADSDPDLYSNHAA
jgi:hypothetical protein